MDYKGMWERLEKELIARENHSEDVVHYAMEFGYGRVDLLGEVSAIQTMRMARKLMADIESEEKDRQR